MKEQISKEYLIDGDNYYPNVKASRSDKLLPGVYETAITLTGVPFFRPIQIVTDSIVDIPNTYSQEVFSDVDKFWSDEIGKKFVEYGLVHKRGIILAGKPGTGKTITLAEVARNVIEKYNAVVLFNPNADTLVDYIRLIKSIEPDKKIVVLWEEFDAILQRSESNLLPLLDGEIQVNNVLYLATTNYISRIPARIKNRPSRFAKIINVSEPNKEAREYYLRAKLHDTDMHLLPSLLDASEGFVIDQLKDLIISVCCFGYSIDVAVRKIKEMEKDSIGLDDYNEDQMKSVFQKNMNDLMTSGPLRPLY